MPSNDITPRTWLITAAGRGMGVDVAQAALAAGQRVVATGRDPVAVNSAVGEHENLLVAPLDVTDASSAERAVAATVERFGRIDVLVNDAAGFLGGFFEELSAEQMRTQIETNLLGPLTVTRAVLPIMRKQRSGLVISISSTARVVGSALRRRTRRRSSAWRAGWNARPTRSRRPGSARRSSSRASSAPSCSSGVDHLRELSIDDYAQRTAETIPTWHAMNGKQAGHPAKARLLLAQVDAHRELSTNLAHDDAHVAA